MTLDTTDRAAVPWFLPVILSALAGGMAWGIRGQYGHETGAMMAGLLCSLVLTLLLCPRMPALNWARAVALCTIAMGFGGSMTYGQTVGLTHDGELVGHNAAWAWGMLGLAVKGGVWIAFAGVFLGMGLGGVRYRCRDFVVLILAMLGAYYLGMRTLNYPFDPANRELPWLYFSDHWRWEPDKVDMEPRREQWGGLLLAWGVVMVYVSRWRSDALAWRMGLWGLLGGAIGFPLGQSIQSYHAWHRDQFTTGLWENLAPYINWWNMMEITFGATMGAILGLGLWLNRSRIAASADQVIDLPTWAEVALLAVHIPMLAAVEFLAIRQVDALYDLGLILGAIPLIAVVGGRWWPYLMMGPITALPIAGKTLRNLGYENEVLSIPAGWVIYVAIPLAFAVVWSVWLLRRPANESIGPKPIAIALLCSAWTFFLLNFAFFRFPWPWAEWTGRTPSGIIYMVCIAALSVLAGISLIPRPDDGPRST